LIEETLSLFLFVPGYIVCLLPCLNLLSILMKCSTLATVTAQLHLTVRGRMKENQPSDTGTCSGLAGLQWSLQ